MPTEDEEIDLVTKFEIFDIILAAVQDKSVKIANQTAEDMFKRIDKLLTERNKRRMKNGNKGLVEENSVN